MLHFFDIFLVVGGLICLVAILGAIRKRKSKKSVGVFGIYDDGSDVMSEKIDFVKKAFVSPSFLIFVLLCAIQSIVTGIMLFTV